MAGASGLALLMSGGLALADSYGGVMGDYPPNAHPGQCFARVLTPEVYETITEKVIDVAEKTELRVIPAEWGTDYKTILVKEGYVEYYVVPTTFKTVTETVVVKPGYTHIEVVPATYETVSEKILVKEAYTVWKPGKGLAGTPGYTGGAGGYAPPAGYAPPPGPGYGGALVDGHAYYGPTKVAPTGELLCLVEVPAEYKVITKTVIKTPARTVEVAVPPVIKTITKTVVDVPAHVEKRDIPPVYDKIQITILVRPERVESIVIPPTYKVIEKKKLVGGGKLEWREIICDDKLTGPLPANAINCSEAGGSCTPTYTPPVYVAPPHATSSYGTKGGYESTTTYSAPPPVYAPPPRTVYKAAPMVTHSYDGERGNAAPAVRAAPTAAAQAQGSSQAQSSQAQAGNMIARMQQALQVRGYYAGPIDGLYTAPTSEALLRFQKDNKMASGQLTLETARALGIWN